MASNISILKISESLSKRTRWVYRVKQNLISINFYTNEPAQSKKRGRVVGTKESQNLSQLVGLMNEECRLYLILFHSSKSITTCEWPKGEPCLNDQVPLPVPKRQLY